jgi:hypothetical protein
MRLLALGMRSPFPAQVKIMWPDYPQDASLAYGYSGERLRPAKISGEEIVLMDEILLLPNLIIDLLPRRVVNARLLIRPVSNTYLYSWSRLAVMLSTDRRRVVRLHYSGLHEIVERLGERKIGILRDKLAQLAI